MNEDLKRIYLYYTKTIKHKTSRREYLWAYAYYTKRIKKVLIRNNIKRKPKRAKREELLKLYIDTFYK